MADAPGTRVVQRRALHRLVAVFAALVLLLASCGFDDESSETADSAGNSASSDSGDAAAPTAATSAAADFQADDTDDGGDSRSVTRSDVVEDAAAASEPTESASDDPTAAEGEENALGSTGATPPLRTAAQRGREIIYTASVSVGVDDVEEAGRQAVQIIAEVGGFISSQNTSGGAEPRSQITFKVDPENFSAAIERLAGIGELRNQTISTDDVTERVVDLQSRIDVTQLGVDRLREAMENTTTLTDFAELENLLLSRESDLEVMRGTLRTLRDQIDLATITLILEQDRVTNAIALGITAYEGQDQGTSCPGRPLEEIVFEPGDEATLCFVIRNDGDQALTSVTITESVLEIEGTDDLILVLGTPEELNPGQSVFFAKQMTIERDLPLRGEATGVPTDAITGEAANPAVRTSTSPVIRVNEDAVDTGFGDGFGAAVGLLAGLWQAVRILVGFVLPLLVLLPIVWIAWIAVRKMSDRRRATIDEELQPTQPPRPPHTSVATKSNEDD
ncbi:MAG: hypothetical protein ACI81L_003477 [Verrucomicrobiales bacterium]|jgi:hypothetical protein